MPAGSFAGPTMMKKLYAMILRSTPYPPVKTASSCEGEWTSNMSASPLSAAAMAAPVPRALKFTVIQGYAAWNAAFMVPVVSPFIPVSSRPVSWRLVVVATFRVTGEGVGVGTGVGLGVGVGAFVGCGVGVGVGATVGAWVGAEVGVTLGADVGVSVGIAEAVVAADGVGVGVTVGDADGGGVSVGEGAAVGVGEG